MSVQLLGISNAIVDVLAHVEPGFLEQIGAPPGSMTLIDEARAKEIYGLMGPATEMSGGSVANTIAGFANLGGKAAYIGKVRDDQLGEIFAHDMRSLNVDVRLKPGATDAPTARSHILITPDGQRTMQTFLGACTELGTADINATTVGSPQITLIEGYVWDLPEGPELVVAAAELTKDAGGRVALSLSDSFCVERHRDEFREFVDKYVDLVFADDDEAMALLEAPDFESTAEKAASQPAMFVITRSEKGSVVVDGETRVEQEAMAIERLVDTTGAGDAYTAGFLYAYANGNALDECTRAGTLCATQVIQQVGARIDRDALGIADKSA